MGSIRTEVRLEEIRFPDSTVPSEGWDTSAPIIPMYFGNEFDILLNTRTVQLRFEGTAPVRHLDDTEARRDAWTRIFGSTPMPEPSEGTVDASYGLLDRSVNVSAVDNDRFDEIVEGKSD